MGFPYIGQRQHVLAHMILFKTKGGDSMKSIRLCSTLALSGVLFLLLLASSTNTVSAEGEIVIQRGENVKISAQLLQNGTFGDPVPNQLIEFFDQTHDALINCNTTDVDGIASINWTIPLGFPLGPTLINATFRGNELLFLSPSTQWIFLNIVSSTQIVIDHENGPFAPGDLFCFTASLFNDANTPIAGSQLIALSGNTVLATSITNSSGIAMCCLHTSHNTHDLEKLLNDASSALFR
jgi:hypothetical protein